LTVREALLPVPARSPRKLLPRLDSHGLDASDPSQRTAWLCCRSAAKPGKFTVACELLWDRWNRTAHDVSFYPQGDLAAQLRIQVRQFTP